MGGWKCQRKTNNVRERYKIKSNQTTNAGPFFLSLDKFSLRRLLTFLGPDEADGHDALAGRHGEGANILGRAPPHRRSGRTASPITSRVIIRALPYVHPLIDGHPGQAGSRE